MKYKDRTQKQDTKALALLAELRTIAESDHLEARTRLKKNGVDFSAFKRGTLMLRAFRALDELDRLFSGKKTEAARGGNDQAQRLADEN